MKLLQGYQGSFKTDLQLEVGASKLGFDLVADEAVTESQWAACKVAINLSSKNGNTTLVPKMRLLDLLNMSALGEGFFIKNSLNLSGTVDLSRFGSLTPRDGYMSISYEGFPENVSTSIFAIDAPYSTNIAQVITEHIVQGTKQINISAKTELFFPVVDGATGIDEITLYYPNKAVTFTDRELQIINTAKNDLMYVESLSLNKVDTLVAAGTPSVKYGYDRLLSLEVSDCREIKVVTLDGSTVKFYTYHNENV